MSDSVPISSSSGNNGGNNNYESSDRSSKDLDNLATGMSDLVLKSSPTKLSVNAAEFVPSWMKTTTQSPTDSSNQQHQQQQQMNNAAIGGNNHHHRSADNSFDQSTQQQQPIDPAAMSDAEIFKYLLSDVRMFVAHLQNSPDSFDDVASRILDLLINYAYDDKILAGVINEIFRAGLEYPNFSYQCARLCGYLATNYCGYNNGDNANPGTSFRFLLLKRCHDEHSARLQGPLPCLYNYGLLLADLYNQMKVENRNISVLGDAVLAVINALLSSPIDGNVACVVRILKLCGGTLEFNERMDNGGNEHASTPRMDQIFQQLETLLAQQQQPSPYGLSEDGKKLIRNLQQTRKDWHKYASASAASSGQQQQQSEDDPGNDFNITSGDMVFFGPDGEELTAEETAFLERELGALQSSSSEEETAIAAMLNASSSDDDGMDEAYEQFLRMTEEKKRQQMKK